jgi:preprotein translocase subunit SecY
MANNMGNAIKNIFKIPELRDRVIFTILALIAFRIGIFIPIPGINIESWKGALSGLQSGAAGGFINFFDVFAGGALSNFSIFVLSVNPYINASIILQLLGSIIPSLKEMLKEGEQGRKKFGFYTRVLTVVLAVLQGLMMAFTSMNYRAVNSSGEPISAFAYIILATTSIVAGSMFVLWIGEMITEKGIGNGISVLIFAGIVSRYPSYAAQALVALTPFEWILLLLIAVVIVIATIAVQQAERRIKVQYAKRVVGNKVMGGSTTYIPIKVNGGGVIPIIFASVIVSLPSMISSFTPWQWDDSFFKLGGAFYLIVYAVLIIFFTYFYSSVVMDPKEVSDNIKNYGGFIPGIRPGDPTSKFITTSMNRVTFIGAIFLVLISLLPYVIRSSSGVEIWIGGTSALIAVGVALDMLQQIESHMIARQYEGFMKKGKLRGRR